MDKLAIEEIEYLLKKQGLTDNHINSLFSRFLEEEAKSFVETIILVAKERK